MRLSHQQLAAALDSISESIGKADTAFERNMHEGDDWAASTVEWFVEQAFSQLKVLCEVLELPVTLAEIVKTLDEARAGGLLTHGYTPGDEPYLPILGPARKFRNTLQTVFLNEPSKTITKDVESILRQCTYAITDPNAFLTLPENEDEVHRRIEAVLRCVFPDLLHKPRLSKPIKNFEPDTGLPSVRTLIEFKFIADRALVPAIADEILADTRGYNSKDWDSFIYTIYETKRFRAEHEWRRLLRDCGIGEDTTVVLLTGSPPEAPNDRGNRRASTRTAKAKRNSYRAN
jgi:REase_DpnII-MboI